MSKPKKAARKVPGGAAERRAKGLHILLIRIPIKLVKRLDARVKAKGLKSRTALVAQLLDAHA
jgi:hypothetical protein